MSNSELAKFTASIDAAWKDLLSFLAAVTPSQASKRDQAGWSVKDHVTHLAVWEDSVAILFRGGRRHEALGIEEAFYTASNFDEINEMIKYAMPTSTRRPASSSRRRQGTTIERWPPSSGITQAGTFSQTQDNWGQFNHLSPKVLGRLSGFGRGFNKNTYRGCRINRRRG